ncbi:MAG: hypothetical protein U5L76_06015 [Patescibacteria group bacterium]|nr:hypothetical protein [Patescibacteria group bacterium]
MKINFDKEKIYKLFKKNIVILIIIIFSIVFLENLYFIYKNIREPSINEAQLSSQEEKINNKLYNQIIEKDNKKTNPRIDRMDNLNNPF